MDSVVILLDRDSHVIDVFATEQDVVEYFSKTEEVHIIDDDRVLVNGCVTYQFEHWDVKSFFGGDDYIPDPHDPDRLVHVDNL
jgi:ABC-type lipopolysaccharide export system ATPase subunit